MSIPVVTVGQSREDLVGGLERLHGPVTVVRRCAELAELMAACQSGIARAAVVAEGSEELTASLVDRLGAVGVAIIALTDNAEEASRLRGLGVASALSGVEPSVLAGKISEAVARHTQHRGRGYDGVSGLSDPAAAAVVVPGAADPAEAREGSGSIIAVWGPAGAPGRTLVAANIAGELAADGKSVILVDADTYGASIAALLGLLDESAGFAQACRLADQGVLDTETMDRIAVPVATRSGTFRVLTGVTRADRWTELRPAALGIVLERAKELADVVVVDVGFCLESDEELSFDTMAPRRNGATLRCLELADTIYAVGSADPVGVPRLVRGLAELEQAVPGASPRVIFNKVRSGAVGRDPERQLRDAWERYGPASAIGAYLPWDPSAADSALLGGSLLLEATPDAPLRHSIAQLVCAPKQQSRRSSVPLSTARRRAKE
ncbi:P-loop NTPase [Pseudarthrobacter sp. J75]|uniref:AAA family ATPase n=1 Tax=unclassified Pseudarthrobacter TaxID=2647000 RepID=UPI002E819E5D|nr:MULTISPECIES: P-loop NTPase [unclassified Pseudarthrobacter]MEE2521381.1 P-loop NTPase [Pseudarthrobacter sp. J47]MEE2528613.1 P-loop NTPase [Pseudarthrobacter sp. J75]MEE2568304.1 P-loop NTPase [Pseudarthrobacter sp. J64]